MKRKSWMFWTVLFFTMVFLGGCTASRNYNPDASIAAPVYQPKTDDTTTGWTPVVVDGRSIGENRTSLVLANGTKKAVQDTVFLPFDQMGLLSEFKFPGGVDADFTPVVDGKPEPSKVFKGRGQDVYSLHLISGAEKSIQIKVQFFGQLAGKETTTRLISIAGKDKL